MKKNLVICICGLAGSGKSTVAKNLAQKYGLSYYSGGDALKALAIEAGYKPKEKGWWESEEGIRFLQQRMENPNFDKSVDKKLLEMGEKGNVVLDSWTMPWLLNKGFKIWLEASSKVRAERLARRDKISFEEALRKLEEKERKTKEIYKQLYGFRLGEDFSPFHFILDVNRLNSQEVFNILCEVIENFLLRRS
jgi:cytidylate kinase